MHVEETAARQPFYVAGESVGVVTRVSRSSVIDVSADGGSVPTLVVG